MVLALAMTACGGASSGSANPTASATEGIEYTGDYTYTLNDIDYSMSCVEGWDCADGWGMSRGSLDDYSSVMPSQSFALDAASALDAATSGYTYADTASVVETYDWVEGVSANLIEDTEDGEMTWVSAWQLDGNYVSCRGSFPGSQRDALLPDVEAMCASLQVK